MRLMSFSMTTEAYRYRKKFVTRRLGWGNLKIGDNFMGVEKAMGLKRGEKVKKIAPAVCVQNEPEPLMDIVRRPVRESGIPEVVLEGFPELTPLEFVEMFVKHNKIDPEHVVNRIAFDYCRYLKPMQRPLVPEAP